MVIVFDLDDTLYDEIDFVKSGFLEISEYLGSSHYFDFMWEEFLKAGSGKIFNKLIDRFKISIPLQKLIEIYRFHKPKISLREDASNILGRIKCNISLITDGHYIMQKNKFYALNLNLYIKKPIFSDFLHSHKLEVKPFLEVMKLFPNDEYVYIGDNPQKDFTIPKRLSWITIRLKNKRGIYSNIENNADFEILNLEEIYNTLKI
ncbi:HAD family hydrolase [Hippea jasoniae]|uniref:HAD family hydrolase n=1 Tax=Hippea jasoniae TaxID=944479 RepID=UPI00054FCCB9|nr:HAD family hydrolase [Hippea jasoniae]